MFGGAQPQRNHRAQLRSHARHVHEAETEIDFPVGVPKGLISLVSLRELMGLIDHIDLLDLVKRPHERPKKTLIGVNIRYHYTCMYVYIYMYILEFACAHPRTEKKGGTGVRWQRW